MQEVRDKVEAFYEAVRVKDGKYESPETIKNEFEKLEKELDARVSGRVVYDEMNDTLTVKKVKNAKDEIVDSVGLDVDGVMNILSERVMRLDLNEINKGDYNQKVSREGRVKSDISPSQHTFNSNIEMNFGDITVTPITEAAPTTTQIDGISSEQYKSFVETGAVSQEIIDYLASKIINGDTLTKEEQAIFTDKTAEVERSIAATTAVTSDQAQPTSTVKVNQFEITYNPQTGEMTFANGNPVEVETVRNKALVAYELQQGTLRRTSYNGTNYAVLSDNRIISLGKTSAGKEVYKSGPAHDKIIEQVGEAPTIDVAPKVAPPSSKPDPFDDAIKNIGDLGDLRTRAVDNTVEYEVWDEKEELAWFKKNYPDVPIEVLDDIKKVVGEGGPDAWGLFRNASVFIQSNAAKGTAYHEAFHAVFNLMLTEKEREAILKSGENFAVGDISIEEYWADKFMDYRLAEGATAHTLPQKIADFFKRLWQMIRIAGERMGIGSASMNDYMYRISKGLYANKVIGKIGDVKFKRNVTRFKVSKTAENGMLNNSEKVFAKRVINGLVIEKVLPYYRNNILNDDTLDDRETLRKIVSDKSDNPLMSLQGVYTLAYKMMHNELVDLVNDGTEKNKSSIDQLSRTLETLTVRDERGLPKTKKSGEYIFRPFLANLVTALANYGVRYNVFTEDVNATTFGETSDILEETEDVIENWMVKEKFMGPYEKFSQKAARLFSTIESNEVFAGLKVFENPSNVKSTLIYEITDSSSDKEMMEKLRKLTLFKPQYDKMYKALQNDKALQAEFYAYLGQLKNTGFMLMYAKEDGTSLFTATNKRNLKNDLVENFRYNMYNNSGYYNPEDNTFKDIPGIEEDIKEFESILKEATKAYNSSMATQGSSETYGLTEEKK